jgi:dihydrofolate synthase / folylpolyglutamate synthase
MADLGNPQDRLPPVIHVAGTNGKGSTIAYLRAIAEAAGLRAHVYTSPHLVRFNERVRLAGRLIDDSALAAILEEIEHINAERPITFFEVTTAAAFLAFARAPADLVLLETGMGGRLDATNLVNNPAAIAITPISFDHMQHLGGTLALIAGEKAGIFKPEVTAALGPQPAEAAEIFAQRAHELGTELFRYGHEWRIEQRETGFRYVGQATIDLPAPVLPGRHQFDNAGLAVAVTENLPGFKITDAHRSTGLAKAEWPARLQRLTKGPLAKLLPPGWELFLDGGHNEAGGAALADWAASQRDGKPLDLVFGMLSTKEPAKFLAGLAPHVRRLRAVTTPSEPLAFPTAPLVEGAHAAGIRDAAAASDLAAAVRDLVAQGEKPSRILICGSLYLAGVVLTENG